MSPYPTEAPASELDVTHALARLEADSLLFKTEISELQSAAILGDGADGMVGSTAGNDCLYLKGDFDRGPRESRQVLNDFLGDPARVAA
jgi:hypothetical protein